ncbi:MAG: hypothetical protein KJ597_01060 [Nanoarchaeota archaeon]|nr:hypothetical protein [Nanoarchaeota archaeon]MBU1622141.1 hypothetical protein [Nanoarchaeota archaeon]
MKLVFVLLVVSLMLFTVGCDTELGHSHEDHDHDGDGIQDHTEEEHHEEHDNFEKELPHE